jgi:hypothetical protein
MAGPFFSTQLTSVNAVSVLTPGLGGGDAFIIPFNFTTAGGGGPAVGELVYLCNIPEGLYIAGLFVQCEAMSTAGAAAGADIGDDDSTQRYAAAQTFDAATNAWIQLVNGTGMLFRNDKLRQLRLTVTGEAWAATKKFFGFVLGFKDA